MHLSTCFTANQATLLANDVMERLRVETTVKLSKDHHGQTWYNVRLVNDDDLTDRCAALAFTDGYWAGIRYSEKMANQG